MIRTVFALSSVLLGGPALAGYDVHITRKAEWFERSGPCISLVEWLAYVRTDPEIKRDLLNTENDFVVSLPRGESFPLSFDPTLGELRLKDPSDSDLAKLIQVAKKLHARVQGDEGEFYPLRP